MNHNQANLFIVVILALSFSLLGASFILGANPNAITVTFEFYGLSEVLPSSTLSVLVGVCMILLSILTIGAFKKVISHKIPTFLGVFISLVALLTLFGESRWIAEAGGFPVIGSGQGIIKYFAVIPLYLFLFYKNSFSDRVLSILNFLPVALVLFWIGGMKFLELEANAIVSLVDTSPFMSWLYVLFDIQTASNIIGVYDILFAVILGLGIKLKSKPFILIGLLACGAVFAMTQTFLVTAPNAVSTLTIFERLGQFVIKDLWFIANLAVIYFLSFVATNNMVNR